MRHLARPAWTLALGLVAGLWAGLTPALAGGPWAVVASSGDSHVTVIDLSTGEVVEQRQVGLQTIGVGVTGSIIALSDFSGGVVRTFEAVSVGNFIHLSKGEIPTAPELVNPEGIRVLGEGSRALLSDGGTLPGGGAVGLLLVDLADNTKVNSLSLPSVYGVDYDPATRTAWVLDGLSMELAAVTVTPAGELVDTSRRIPLNGTQAQPRYIALYAGGTRALVSHKTDGAVEVLDLVAGSSLGRLEGIGTSVGGIAVTPDGARALVADFGTSRWAVVDLTGPYGPVDTGIRVSVPKGVPNTFVGTRTFAFEGDLLYFSSSNSNVLSALNWITLALEPLAYPTGLSPAGMDIAR